LLTARTPNGFIADSVDASAADYKTSLAAVPGHQLEQREEVLHGCHQRSADKLLKLCFDNGGIYIKLGQHIGQLVGERPASHCYNRCTRPQCSAAAQDWWLGRVM